MQYPPREIKFDPPDTRKNLSTEQARDELVADAIYNEKLKKKKGTTSQDSPENYIKKADNPLKISELSTFIGGAEGEPILTTKFSKEYIYSFRDCDFLPV